MGSIYILFDCPDAQNDKKWLIDELTRLHSGKVTSVSIHHTLSILARKGLFARIASKLIAVWQALRAVISSKPGDTLICWQEFTGKICAVLSNLLGNRRKLILMNWLTPEPSCRKWDKTYRMILHNPMCRVTVNSPDSPKEWAAFLGISAVENFRLLPDVFDTEVTWNEPNPGEDRYCFTGGMNNRDWALLARIAKKCPQIKFVCVALESDFKEQVQALPANVEVHFDIPAKVYYGLMNHAYAVLLPLKDHRVAGLINIIRAAQAGVLCCITRTPSTQQYYPADNSDLLMDMSEAAWIGEIHELFGLSPEAYAGKVKKNQAFIAENFSGAAAAKKLLEIIRED